MEIDRWSLNVTEQAMRVRRDPKLRIRDNRELQPGGPGTSSQARLLWELFYDEASLLAPAKAYSDGYVLSWNTQSLINKY